MFSEVTCSSELLYYVPLVQISLLSRATTLRTIAKKAQNQSGNQHIDSIIRFPGWMFSEVTCSSELLYYVPLVQILLLSCVQRYAQ